MVGKTVVFLLIVTGCYASSKDEVSLQLGLRCYFQNADFNITLWEWDRLSPDDYLSKREGGIRDSNEYTAFLYFHEFLDGDEAFSSEYKFYVTINHDCGSKAWWEKYEAKVWLKPACEEGKTCFRYYVFDLYKMHGEYNAETTYSSLYWSEYNRVESAKEERIKEEERKEKEKRKMEEEKREMEEEREEIKRKQKENEIFKRIMIPGYKERAERIKMSRGELRDWMEHKLRSLGGGGDYKKQLDDVFKDDEYYDS